MQVRRSRRGPACIATAAALVVASVLGAPSVGRAEPGPTSLLNWVFDGKVSAATRVGNTLYVGGSFSSVAPPSGALGSVHAVSTSTGAAASPAAFPVIDGVVRVILPDGSGGFYVGGGFSTVGGVAQPNLVHVLADGSRDPAFTPRVDDVVTELALTGNALFVSGYFSTVGGEPRRRLAEVDATTGAVRSFAPVLPVLFTPGALDIVGTRLLVGASAAMTDPNLFAFEVATGTLLWQRTIGNGALVADIASGGGRVFVAGAFALSTPQSGVAAIDPATGAVDASWPAIGAQFITSIEASGTTLYVAGPFNTLGGQNRPGLGALDVATGAVLPWNPVLLGFVTSMVVLPNGNVVVAPSALSPQQSLRQIDPTGAVTSWRSAVAVGTVTALAADPGGRLAVGTPLGSTGGAPRANLAAFDLLTGALLPWAPSANGAVHGMATDGDRVFIGGAFTEISGTPRNGLASLTLLTGDVYLWDPRASGGFLQIGGLVADATHLYVHGAFSVEDRGTTVANLARFELRNGLLDVSWVPALPYVRAVAVGADDVYVSGARPGATQPVVFALDRATGRARPWTASLGNGDVRALALDGDTLYLGGAFGAINGVARSNLAAVDRRTGATLGFSPPPLFNFEGMAVADGLLVALGYIGGFIELPSATLVALRGDGSSAPWAPRYSLTLGFGSAASALLAAGDRLIVTGGFGTLTPTPLQGLAVFPLDGLRGPTSLRSTWRGAETVLNWTPSSPAAAGYVLEAGSTPDNLGFVLPVGNVTSFAALLPPQSYFVRVRPVGASGAAAAPSNAVMVHGACASPPGPPLGLDVSVAGSTVQLSWRQGEWLASRYHLLVGTAPGLADITTIAVPSNQTSFAGQAPPGTYHVRVRAENACGIGAPSATVSFVVGGATALPPAPAFLGGSAAGATVALAWAPPPAGVTGHVIEAGTASGLADLGAFAISATPSFIATGVPPGVYVVRVRATNAAGTGPPSADIVIRVP